MINFLSNEKLASIETGDVLITKLTQEGSLVNREQLDYIQKNKYERVLDVDWFFVGRDPQGDAVGIALDANKILHSNRIPCWNLSEDEYGESNFNSLIEQFNKFPIEERKNLDLHLSRYIYNEWIFDVKKSISGTLIPGGMKCCECKDFYHYAVPNLSNGNLACWNCRDLYKWKYSKLYVGGK